MAEDNYVNWQDYYGLNQGAYQQEAQGLVSGLDSQNAAYRTAAADAARGQFDRGRSGGGGADWQGKQASDALLSYGDAVARLQDPATLQAAMEGSGHARRNASMLDAAGTQQAGGDQFRAAAGRYDEAKAYGNEQQRVGQANYERGAAYTRGLAAQNADLAAQRQKAALAKAAEAKRATDWENFQQKNEATGGGETWAGTNKDLNAQFAANPDDVGQRDAQNVEDLYAGRTAPGSVSNRLRDLYGQSRKNALSYATYGTSGKW